MMTWKTARRESLAKNRDGEKNEGERKLDGGRIERKYKED